MILWKNMLTCIQWKNSPTESSLASPKIGAKIGIRRSYDNHCLIFRFTIYKFKEIEDLQKG